MILRFLLPTEAVNSRLRELGTVNIGRKMSLKELLRRPGLTLETLLPLTEGGIEAFYSVEGGGKRPAGESAELADLSDQADLIEAVEIDIKYEGYITGRPKRLTVSGAQRP